MDLREGVYTLVSAQVSAPDNRPMNVMQTVGASAFLYDWADLIRRMFNYLNSPSATLISGGSAGAVALTGDGLPSGLNGVYHGWPFSLSHTGTLSGSPTSLASTTSTTIRKVLVTIGMSAFPFASSVKLASGTLQFVYGSVFATSAGAVLSGGASTYFNSVPLPKPSAGEIPVGWLNICNSFATSAGISNTMMITDWREVQGVDLSAIMGVVRQP